MSDEQRTPQHGRHRPPEVTDPPQQEQPSPTPPHGLRQLTSWATRSHLLVAVLCGLLGFALVVQVRQTQSDELAFMRQDDLVQLLDEITQRNDQLEAEQDQLNADRADLLSGVDAREVAERNAEVQGVLAGTVPVHGPGLSLVVTRAGNVPASAWVNLMEELRNAGAEAIEVGGVRVGVSTWFADVDGTVVIDGVELSDVVAMKAIGDPQTLEVALGIPGGALATLRSSGAQTQIDRIDDLQVLTVRELRDPQIASPAPEPTPTSG